MSVEKAKVVEVVKPSFKMPTVWVFVCVTKTHGVVVHHVSSAFDSKEEAEAIARRVTHESISSVRVIEIPGES